jgi:predicted nuclease with TOPRIM domain
MTKEEIKNRISLALKAPILQQGFEIICKENAELKKACDETQELLDKQIEATLKLDKENAELIQENEEMKKGLGCETCQIHLEYMRLNNKIDDLEKENAELNEKLSEQKQYTAFKCNEFVKYKEVYEREHFFLTSAKEIIREFVEWANWQGNSKCPSFKSIQDKAEQFIKYSEVENDSNS